MIKVARGLTDKDAAEAAGYFAALPRRAWVRVVETDTVPATRPTYFGWLEAVPGGAREPIGHRIIELPEDWPRMILEDPHSGIIDYVPPGAPARGAALVRQGGPAGQPCRSCHGETLRGTALAPPLAGRSATYLARMLWDMKTGARGGPTVALMRGPVAGLTPDQITDITAYLASLKT